MYLVMKLLKESKTSLGVDASFVSSEVAGVVPVFRRYEDAFRYCEDDRLIVKVEKVNQNEQD